MKPLSKAELSATAGVLLLAAWITISTSILSLVTIHHIITDDTNYYTDQHFINEARWFWASLVVAIVLFIVSNTIKRKASQ